MYKHFFKRLLDIIILGVARSIRHLKTNLGKKNAFQKMMRLIDEMEFEGLRDADEIKKWDLAEVVKV